MSDANLKKWIRQFLRDELAAHGFELSKPRLIQRHLDGLRQGMEFQPGTGHLAGKYTINVFWSYAISPINSTIAMHAVRRVGDFAGEINVWYDREDLSQFAAVTDLILTEVLPYLDSFSSIRRILQAIEGGLIASESAFPTDPGWRDFYLGYCYLHVGNVAQAKTCLERVVHGHSTATHGWILERRNVASATLSDITDA
ncbi:hypothetical protein [Paraburkholderia sediminicola]|uniref:hypothetical protein n=1 Tax=Paraburkholderia sediminicola TaxID=458836 RepID=UPI0038BCD9AE